MYNTPTMEEINKIIIFIYICFTLFPDAIFDTAPLLLLVMFIALSIGWIWGIILLSKHYNKATTAQVT